jgi:hypothetical protein
MRRKSKRFATGMPRLGRPPLPPGEKLGERITVQLTRAEARALRRLAGRYASPGAVLRRLLRRELERTSQVASADVVRPSRTVEE